MKLVTQYEATFADYGGKQVVPAYMQEERHAKKIAAVRVQFENSRRLVLSDQGTYICICDHIYKMFEV